MHRVSYLVIIVKHINNQTLVSILKRSFYNSSFRSSESLYEIINFLINKTHISNIIYVGNIDENALKDRFPETSLYFIGDRKLFKNSTPNKLNIIKFNLSKGLPKLDEKILKKSVVILDSVIETIPNPNKLLKDLVKWQYISPCILISTPDKNRNKRKEGWDLEELKEFLNSKSFHSGFYGYFPRQLYKEKKEILYIGGKLSCFSLESRPLKVCAIVSTYNEQDIILQVCKYLLDQGLYVHLIDNWSTDLTLKIIKKIALKEKKLSYEVFPDEDRNQYEWFKILDRKLAFSEQRDYDWYIHYDADEIREGCWQETGIVQNIQLIDELGFNAIDHTVLDFRPVNDRFNENKNPQEVFNFFEFGKRPGHFEQVKAWKKKKNISYDLSSSGGHIISFQGARVFPYKFLLRHYPLRSLEQMKKKIFQDRLPRFKSERRKYGWHVQYDKYQRKSKDVSLWDKNDLLLFDDCFYEEYLLERLMGINIRREK